MTKRNSTYKPLLFTTTMRNPERLKDFLSVLFEYDSRILTVDLIDSVVKSLIKQGLYKPTITSNEIKAKWNQGIELSDDDAEQIFVDNPQHHKEAGFERGWPSRFDTWYKLGKELGFVYYWQGEKIEFSESGKMLLDKDKPENEQLVFANAFAKYQRHNPFRRISNKNVPLILLLETIKHINADATFNGTGILRQELPILLCWQNNDAWSLYKQIKDLRKRYAYSPSDETILEICDTLLDEVKRDERSILRDYTDDFIRKMRLTGLVSIRGGGRFIDINTKENNAISYILNTYRNYREYTTERAFFEHISSIDHNLINKLTVYQAPTRTTKRELEKWVKHYEWEEIKTEMTILSDNKSSKDDILKVIEKPLRLEFLTTLAILKKLPNVVVKPNFVSDDEGLPVSFASGKNPDIECSENNEKILVEVTLLTGTQQHIRESFSIQRHLEDFLNKGHQAFSLFISPKAFIDTCRYAKFIATDGHHVQILDIKLFINQLESHKSLREASYTASSCS